jgi:hypothetical protein
MVRDDKNQAKFDFGLSHTETQGAYKELNAPNRALHDFYGP